MPSGSKKRKAAKRKKELGLQQPNSPTHSQDGNSGKEDDQTAISPNGSENHDFDEKIESSQVGVDEKVTQVSGNGKVEKANESTANDQTSLIGRHDFNEKIKSSQLVVDEKPIQVFQNGNTENGQTITSPFGSQRHDFDEKIESSQLVVAEKVRRVSENGNKEDMNQTIEKDAVVVSEEVISSAPVPSESESKDVHVGFVHTVTTSETQPVPASADLKSVECLEKSDYKRDFKEVQETSASSETKITMVLPPTRPSSWKSCCGLLDLFTGGH